MFEIPITRINAQFVEMDSGTFEEQQAKIDAFPLAPSMIIRTQKSLQRLHLCDSLTVQYTKLGIKNTAKIVKTKYNVLLERYDSLTIGETKTSLGSYS